MGRSGGGRRCCIVYVVYTKLYVTRAATPAGAPCPTINQQPRASPQTSHFTHKHKHSQLTIKLTPVVETSPPRPPAHLDVLPTAQPPEGAPVPLACAREGDRLGGHVEASGEGLCGKQNLEQTLLCGGCERVLWDRGCARVCAQSRGMRVTTSKAGGTGANNGSCPLTSGS